MPENNNRILQSNPKDLTKTKLLDHIVNGESLLESNFYLGQVINSNDPLKGNRLKIRIPLLDDIFYRDDKGNDDESAGDSQLPWCLPANTRFIETPENGSVVLVALFDVNNPYLGRIWFNSISDEIIQAIFNTESLVEEETNDTAWKNAEKFSGVRYNFNPATNNRKRVSSNQKEINYKVGIRGKNKNKIVFDNKVTTIVQNEGEEDESIIELSDKTSIRSKKFEILSSNTPRRKENPVFAKPLFDFETKFINIVQKVIQLLSTVPAISPGPSTLVTGTNIAPNPAFGNIAAEIAKLKVELEKLKRPGEGSSQYIDIN